MLDATGAFARNKNRRSAPTGRVARVKDDFLPRGEAPPTQGRPVTDQKE